MKCTECGNTSMQEVDVNFWWCPACNNEIYDEQEATKKINKSKKGIERNKQDHPRRKNQWRKAKQKGAE